MGSEMCIRDRSYAMSYAMSYARSYAMSYAMSYNMSYAISYAMSYAMSRAMPMVLQNWDMVAFYKGEVSFHSVFSRTQCPLL